VGLRYSNGGCLGDLSYSENFLKSIKEKPMIHLNAKRDCKLCRGYGMIYDFSRTGRMASDCDCLLEDADEETLAEIASGAPYTVGNTVGTINNLIEQEDGASPITGGLINTKGF